MVMLVEMGAPNVLPCRSQESMMSVFYHMRVCLFGKDDQAASNKQRATNKRSPPMSLSVLCCRPPPPPLRLRHCPLSHTFRCGMGFVCPLHKACFYFFGSLHWSFAQTALQRACPACWLQLCCQAFTLMCCPLALTGLAVNRPVLHADNNACFTCLCHCYVSWQVHCVPSPLMKSSLLVTLSVGHELRLVRLHAIAMIALWPRAHGPWRHNVSGRLQLAIGNAWQRL